MVEQQQIQKLTCPECGWIAKNRAGLNGHRQFKHGIRPTAQLPLEEHDRLVSESRLADALMGLDARLYEAIEQVSERLGQLREQVDQQLGQLKEQVDQGASTLKQLNSITREQQLRLNEVADGLPNLKGDILSCQGRLNKLEPKPGITIEQPKPETGTIFKQS